MNEDDPLTMEHPGHVNQGTRDALDKAAQCARNVLDTIAHPPEVDPSDHRAVAKAEDVQAMRIAADGMGVVLHLGAALVYAIEDVVLAIYEHRGP